MEAGLLESLRKYRPREGHDPLENFVTEAFAWILRNHSDFSEFFLKYLIEKLNIKWTEFDPINCEWITQYNFNGNFADMVCLSNDNAIVFEHKTGSKLGKDQLKNYKEYAGKNFFQSKIVLITASRYQHSQNPDLAICWSDIYELISQWLKENEASSFIFLDFLKLLEIEGMGPPAPISHESIKYYYASIDLKENIGNVLKHTENEDWEVHVKRYPEEIAEKKGKLSYSKSWGRMGFNLLDSWKPGIFVGILLDGNDHCTKPIDILKGPDFCLILDFDKNLHAKYPSNENYKKLVSEITEKVHQLNDGWQFYNHLSDNQIRSRNKWHPIHIRKSMIDVFAGSTNVEEQAQVFYITASELIKIVASSEYFLKLRDEFKSNL